MSAYRHVLAAVDFGKSSRRTVTTAAVLARAAGARLSLLHVSPARLTDTSRAERLGRLVDLLPAGDTSLGTNVALAKGRPVREILSFAAANGVDLIVFGQPRRRELARAFTESVGEQISEQARCSVMAVGPDEDRATHRTTIARVLCAVDLQGTSAGTIEAAATVAARTGAELIVLHVVEPWCWTDSPSASVNTRDGLERDARDRLIQLIAAHSPSSVKTTPVAVVGLSSSRILEEAGARHADLLVIGAHTARVLGITLLGGAAQAALADAPCPVLLVRPPQVPRRTDVARVAAAQ